MMINDYAAQKPSVARGTQATLSDIQAVRETPPSLGILRNVGNPSHKEELSVLREEFYHTARLAREHRRLRLSIRKPNESDLSHIKNIAPWYTRPPGRFALSWDLLDPEKAGVVPTNGHSDA
ncbi:unnamed protein product, partial [Brenthis ino]